MFYLTVTTFAPSVSLPVNKTGPYITLGLALMIIRRSTFLVTV